MIVAHGVPARHRTMIDRTTTTVLRATLGAIGNAEAVEVPVDGPAAGARTGVGATDVPRRVLTGDDVLAVVRAERAGRTAAAAQLAASGAAEAAQDLRSGAAVLDRYLPSEG